MPRQSAGVLMYRWREDVLRKRALEVFLVHPGGPFWAKKDAGAWSIPKGEYAADQVARDAAEREFREETGFHIQGELVELGTVKQAGGKVVSAWCVEGDGNPADLVSNTFEMEWPARSGKLKMFPEVDRGEWFTIDAARNKILKSQEPLLDSLVSLLLR